LVAVGESEPNNTPATADLVPLGFGPGEDVAVDVSASIGPLPVVIGTGEDDGSIPLANPTGLVSGSVVSASATIGDGPFGATSGDYDFYSLLGLSVGDVVTVDIDADILGSELDSYILVFDSVGNFFAFNDDFDTLDSYLEFPAIDAGDYYVAVSGYFSGIPDPFDSSSGGGAASTGDYQIKIGLNVPLVTIISPSEDDGSIPLANPTGLVSGAAVGAIGFIGDGPYGFSSGDYDFYQVPSVAAGDVITVDIGAEDFFLAVDSVVVIYDSAGTLLAFNDQFHGNDDSFLEFTAPYADDYYVAVFDYYSGAFPSDPFDSSSGGGVGNIDFYIIKIGLNVGDADYYALDLNAGDILGANVAGGANGLSLRDSGGVELLGSHQDASFIYPAASPLPGGGNAALAWVIDTPGTYYVRADGSGLAEPYDLNLRVFRPVLEAELIGTHQILFLDFDGANVDRSIFGGGGVAVLSPLSSFLGGWGLAPGDESAVIDAIVASVEENLSADLRALGNNGDYDATAIPGQFDIEIRNSRDHADPWGLPNVSRVIVGGTIPELGIGIIGIAESIDVGNFDTTETAVVLLDLLSAPAANPNSLNQYPLDPSATIFDLIGTGVGNITSHEAGHFFANFHTDQFNGFENADLMDQGGFLDNIVGVGDDFTFGSPDDVDVDFGKDAFAPNEGFTGTQDTLNSISYGLSTGIIPPPDAIAPRVTSVVVSSPAWSGAFVSYLESHGLGTGGYAIPVGSGAAQLSTLPWTNLRQIKLTFSENVVVAADDLKVAGVNVPNYALPPGGFSYNGATHVATWTFASNLNADKLLLALDSTAVSGVHDIAGNRLDGEWDNPTGPTDPVSDTFPSGNGTAGGHFTFRFNVLPGDTTGNWITFLDDSFMTALRRGANTSSSRFGHRFDVDGSGAINGTDQSLIAGKYWSMLPTREPLAPVFPAAAVAAADRVFAEIGSKKVAVDPATAQLAFLDDAVDELLGAKKPATTTAPLVVTAAKPTTAAKTR
jgi:hypothetical protein